MLDSRRDWLTSVWVLRQLIGKRHSEIIAEPVSIDSGLPCERSLLNWLAGLMLLPGLGVILSQKKREYLNPREYSAELLVSKSAVK